MYAKTTMNRFLLSIICLIAVATVADAHRCGTKAARTSGKADCMNTDCDTEAGRAPYYYTEGSSPIYSITVNSILFGDINDPVMGSNFNGSMATFKSRYRSLLGIDVNIRTTFVTDEYQSVGDNDQTTHQAMATKYYRQGELTVMFSQFTKGDLYGYAILPWGIDPNNLAGFYAIMTNSPGALSPDNTTIVHEVGHMLGLMHVFNEPDDCSDCIERPSSPDRNVVGDFCNDTLPMANEASCTTLQFTKNCKQEDFAPMEQLPLNNYMAYTTDSCQTLGFTPQQAARARCYLATKLTFLNPGSTPQSSNNPTASNTPGKASNATSVVGTIAIVLSALITVAL